MSDRDLIIERLEKKLAEKEKEIRELRKVAGMSIEELKSEIIREISEELGKLKALEAKVAELNKTVESLMNEVLYLKAEIAKSEPKSRDIREISEITEREEKVEERKDSEDEIIVCD
ncbi:hypothetical protein GAH_01057 [Geoglobus ahangari]|uniref:Uncharacterized protein n=1 Tax=Geoglobus ahangari TaxID=113653 RepID=A0A0F7IFI1_9EURY|nr:hypothetical protein [Geoglobus ahangari]AKG91623.1 hypothetical protein GAH_01057 [Geoglobus ahangari]NOY11048.1 hypothetical protein [Archaeoglobi archaeon]